MSDCAYLLRLPDGRPFWLAPDDMRFDTRGYPVIRRSLMDQLMLDGADHETIRQVVMMIIELRGDGSGEG